MRLSMVVQRLLDMERSKAKQVCVFCGSSGGVFGGGGKGNSCMVAQFVSSAARVICLDQLWLTLTGHEVQ